MLLFRFRILLDQRKSFNVRYDFIFDRCRAVRQEMVIQKFSAAQTAKVLEPIVMFLSFSLYRLSGCDMAIFDKKICTQHLNECLLKCLSCYEELDGDDMSDEYTIEKRSLIEGIYLMLNLGESSALHRALKLNNALKTAYIVKMSIRISINFHLKHFFKVIRDIQDLSHIVAAVASLKLPHIRMEVLSVFSIAYSSKTLKVPVDFITKILVYDEKSKLVDHLRHLGIYDETDENPTAITFNRGKFNRTVLMASIRKINITSQNRQKLVPLTFVPRD